MNAPSDWQEAVSALMEKARKEERKYHTAKAVALYEKALDLVPEPVESWVVATQLYATLGELAYLNGQPDAAFEYFSQAVRCKGGLGLGAIHLRLGQLRYQRGELNLAKDELMRAYMAAGKRIFGLHHGDEDQKYYDLIREEVERSES